MRGERRARRRKLGPAHSLALLFALMAAGTVGAAVPTPAATVPPNAAAPPASNNTPATKPVAKPLDLELLEFLAEFSEADGFTDPFVLDSTVNRAAAEALDKQIDEEQESAAKAKTPAAKGPQEDDDGR